MSTRDLLGVVGAGVGAFIGFPLGNPLLGAQIGFTVGSGVGQIVDPVTIKGPSLNDAPIQTSRDGVPITLFWGLQYGKGNILQKNPEVITTVTTSSGKGGGPETEQERRHRTFAIGIGNTTIGPIAEVTRIWENNQLVYDTRAVPAIPIAETNKYAEGITIYLGTEDQLPDPELESHWGIDETPAYRGLAYIVWNNKDLTDFGGAIPQFAFEVNGSKDATITSRPYPIEAIDAIQPTAGPAVGLVWSPPIEGLDPTVLPLDGSLTNPLVTYDYEEEGIDPTVVPLTGLLEDRLKEITYEEEGIDPTVLPVTGLLEVRLITHDYEEEGIDATITPLDGSLI